jgi:hypothetical protein
MNSIRLIFAFVLILVLSAQLMAQSAKDQKKFDKQLAKIDKTFNSGQFQKANSALTKFKKGVTSKLGQSNAYMPGYYIREARIHLNLGVLTGFDNSLTNAINASFSMYGETSTKYATTLVEVAETYALYGNYRISREFLIRAKNIVIKANPADPILMGRINLELANTYIGQGFCNQAIDLLSENEKYFAERAIEKEVYVEDGKIKNKMFSEVADLFAADNNLLVEVQGERDLQSAVSVDQYILNGIDVDDECSVYTKKDGWIQKVFQSFQRLVDNKTTAWWNNKVHIAAFSIKYVDLISSERSDTITDFHHKSIFIFLCSAVRQSLFNTLRLICSRTKLFPQRVNLF